MPWQRMQSAVVAQIETVRGIAVGIVAVVDEIWGGLNNASVQAICPCVCLCVLLGTHVRLSTEQASGKHHVVRWEQINSANGLDSATATTVDSPGSELGKVAVLPE